MIHRHATKRKIRFARKMRRKPTRGERAFKKIAKKLEKRMGARFWGQTVLLGWIVDFWCPKLKLVVEIDGATHDDTKDYDEYRANTMTEELGAQTVRFTNFDVINNPALVEAQMVEIIRERRAA